MLVIQSFNVQQNNAVWFEECLFFNIIGIIQIIRVADGPDIQIIGCKFYDIHNATAFTKVYGAVTMPYIATRVTIANTNFSSITTQTRGLIVIQQTYLHLTGPVVFKDINNIASRIESVINLYNSKVTLSSYIEFQKIKAASIFVYWGDYLPYKDFVVFLVEDVTVNITRINVFKFAMPEKEGNLRLGIQPPCYFQYLSDRQLDNQYIYHNYSLLLHENTEIPSNNILANLPITHCRWLPVSAFKTAMPYKVNSRYIRYANQSGQFDASQFITRKKSLCFCKTNASQDCHKDLLDPIYPGQTMTLNIDIGNLNIPAEFRSSNNTIITVVSKADWLPPTACVMTNSSELLKTIENGICTTLRYTIAFPTQNWCELFLKGFHDDAELMDIYYIEQLPCPIGFTKVNGMCKCYPFLYKFNIKIM